VCHAERRIASVRWKPALRLPSKTAPAIAAAVIVRRLPRSALAHRRSSLSKAQPRFAAPMMKKMRRGTKVAHHHSSRQVFRTCNIRDSS
jgi:hypothetical protein